MTVYVDRARFRLGRMIMCHMVADSLGELHTMAERLGVRRWFQDKPGRPHYDLSKASRTLAVALGAVEVSSRELVEVLKRANK